MTAIPAAPYKQRYDELIASIKARGLWDKLDVLYIFAGLHDQTQAPTLNWKNPGISFTLATVGGGLVFSADGAAGDGSSKAANTGFIPATHGVKYALNSSHIGAYFADLAALNKVDVGAGKDYLNGRSASSLIGGEQQTTSAASSSATNSTIGHKAVVRVTSTTVRFYSLGRILGNTITNNSSALSAESIYIGAQNVAGVLTLPSSRKMKAVHLGSGGTDWTATETAQMQAALSDFFVPSEAIANSQADTFLGASIEGGGVGAIDRGGFIYANGIQPANGDTIIVKIDKSTRKIVERFTLCTLYPSDWHMDPALDFLPDGRMIVAYTGHEQDGVVRFRRATGSRLSTLGNEVAVSALTATTYTKFIQNATAGVLYLVFRETPNQWEVFKSTDYGDTWTRKKRLANFGALQSYVTLPASPPRTTSVLNGVIWAHPDNAQNKIAAFTWDRSTDTIQDASGVLGTLNDGTVTTGLLTYASMTAIYTPAASRSQAVYTMLRDGSAFIFQEFDTTVLTNVKYYFALRNPGGGSVYQAGGWTITEITGLARATVHPVGAGGISFDERAGLSGLAFYVSRESGGTYTIERWTSSDNGANWSSSVVATSASKLIRPCAPLDNDATIPVLWGQATFFTAYNNFGSAAFWG